VPGPTAVTSPLLLTVAILVVGLDHDITRPVRTLLLASTVVAESCCVDPTCNETLAGEMEIAATGTGGGVVTVNRAEADFPSDEAVIAVTPAATAVTRPLVLTEATVGSALDHATVRPVSTLLFASSVVAVSCCEAPVSTVDDEGDMVTDATGTGAGALTVIGAEPVRPSLMATILVEPGVIAVTSPVELTDAMSALSLDHDTVLS